MPPATQHELTDPPSDAISCIDYAPGTSSLRLLVSSWDRHVHLYDTTPEDGSGGLLIRRFEHRAPVLAVCFGKDDTEAFSGGLDLQVKRIDLESGEQSVLSVHEAGVNCVVYDRENTILISSSWDSTLHIHHLSSPETAPMTIRLPSKPHSLSLSPSKLVVAMSARLLHIYELSSLVTLRHSSDPSSLQPWQTRESSLKFMTRAVASMPNDAGYASSSIEGRVAVEWFDPSTESQSRKYAFKCHRQPSVGDDGESTDLVYPVNVLAFHPMHGTFASGGGDGFVALWDALGKRRIRQYQKYPASVAAVAFSGDGKFLAVGVCPGFEDGMEDYAPGTGQTRLFVRELGAKEAIGKGAK